MQVVLRQRGLPISGAYLQRVGNYEVFLISSTSIRYACMALSMYLMNIPGLG